MATISGVRSLVHVQVLSAFCQEWSHSPAASTAKCVGLQGARGQDMFEVSPVHRRCGHVYIGGLRGTLSRLNVNGAVFVAMVMYVAMPHVSCCPQVPPAEHLAISCHRTILELCRSVPKEVSCFAGHEIKQLWDVLDAAVRLIIHHLLLRLETLASARLSHEKARS